MLQKATSNHQNLNTNSEEMETSRCGIKMEATDSRQQKFTAEQSIL